MKPEDLVGRRIRFLPYGERNGQWTVHNFKTGTEAVVIKVNPSMHSRQDRPLWLLTFEREVVISRTYKTREHHAWPNVDFEVIDEGEIPYSWRV